MKTIFFGGAFNPFHREHRKLIEASQRYLHADRVVVYPSFSPPHKDRLDVSYEWRRKMAKVTLSDLSYTVIDDIEKERNRINYSYEVIPLLKEKYPSDEYYFLIGGDSLVHFFSWVKPEIIAKEITLAVIDREDVSGLREKAEEIKEKLGAKIILLPFKGKDVSSSFIRTQAEFSLPMDDVYPEVEKIIQRNGLYRMHKELVDRIKADMNPSRYEHVCRTTLYAVKLNTGLNLPYEKVFLAAFLHDCAKHIDEHIPGVPDAVVHQYTGAERAEMVYGITDQEVLDAIRYHATGKPDMTKLGKLIYSADMLEEGRHFSGVAKMRSLIETDFEKGFQACVSSCLRYLRRDEKTIDPLTEQCAIYYNIE